ncbi:hypothetical protein B1C78_09885 [Thioalkalivibrio denitrificans]|uniref:Uncharacterized protein n=1 Tax=Thioalkalivibrio denitrificans TaxID=108003 RepID=A0A1V3NFY1_9GAMM|nr:hypothetical protein [Thioalkalivibrio denitrificans]OOG23833.1 hypothetical protein B1C78_09885 [Thioalkalivibrio denitrificans]
MTQSPDDPRIPTLTKLIKAGSGKGPAVDDAAPADTTAPPEVTEQPTGPDGPQAVGPDAPASDEGASLVDKAMSRLSADVPPDTASPTMPNELDIDLQLDELDDLPFHSLEQVPEKEVVEATPAMDVDSLDEALRARVDALAEQILAEHLPELRTKLVDAVMASLGDAPPSSPEDSGKD